MKTCLMLEASAPFARTVTVAEAVCVAPLASVAVAVYVVVEAGWTDIEPFGCTLPMPGAMLTVVAFCEPQVSVADWPGEMVFGAALISTASWFAAATVTVACAVALPPGPVT